MQDKIKLDCSCPESQVYLTNQQIKTAYQQKRNLYKYFRAPHEKMYRKCTICDLKFDESLATGEDIVFNLCFLKQANAVRTISYCGYNFRKRFDSITHQTALTYSVLLEHSYVHYYKAKEVAQKNWGFSEEYLKEEQKRANPSRYFYQVMNLILPSVPYNKKQVKKKIKEIHEDEVFIKSIVEQKYSDLSLKGKVAKLSIE